MLLEAPPYYFINGVSLMRDHTDPLQYYYLPLGPSFVTREEGGAEIPQFLLIRDMSQGKASGFADFDVHLGLPAGGQDGLRDELQRLAGLDRPPRLAPVPVVDGSVSLMLFGAQSGAAGAEGPADLVRSIRHATKPALFGDNRAAFSVELGERGTRILDKVIAGELAPIGIVYQLDYLALRPAYHIRLAIDWDRAQDIMDTTFGHEGLFDSVQINDVCERLIEERVITFEADTLVPEDEENGTFVERRDAAIARTRDMITDAFFESSLDPAREPPDGWDRASEVVSSFSPQRTTPLGMFSYRKTHYSRVDSKRLDVNFAERITIRRTMYPQGHLSGLFRLLAAGIDRSRLVVSVDADDPWYQRRKVRLISTADHENDHIRQIEAAVTYDGQRRTALLDAANRTAEIEWPSKVENGRMVTPIELEYTVNFQPADAGERPLRLTSQVQVITTEAATIEPRELFDLETIPVLAGHAFPFDRYPVVDVELRYDDAAHGIRQNDLVRLTRENPATSWQRFLVGPPAGPVLARISYRAADGRDHITPFIPVPRPQVDVPDPFPRRLKIMIIPVLDFAQVDRAFVDLVYEDPANTIRVEDSIEVTKDQQPRPFVADRADPSLSRTRYRVTVLMLDSTVRQGPWSTTQEQRILVGSDPRGHRCVTLSSPTDFAAQGLERIRIDARATDETADLSTEDRFEFTAPGATAVFEFDFRNPTADAFDLKIGRLFLNGMSSETDWSRFDQDSVTVAATT
ncbi:hypothetical protein AB1484_18710 [Parafrankia sp. FMc6]|uniref:hypothetical protein n=1 Tax=Parafrankia soli TaxID=2599596 RepID=UPI0034D62991